MFEKLLLQMNQVPNMVSVVAWLNADVDCPKHSFPNPIPYWDEMKLDDTYLLDMACLYFRFKLRTDSYNIQWELLLTEQYTITTLKLINKKVKYISGIYSSCVLKLKPHIRLDSDIIQLHHTSICNYNLTHMMCLMVSIFFFTPT